MLFRILILLFISFAFCLIDLNIEEGYLLVITIEGKIYKVHGKNGRIEWIINRKRLINSKYSKNIEKTHMMVYPNVHEPSVVYVNSQGGSYRYDSLKNIIKESPLITKEHVTQLADKKDGMLIINQNLNSFTEVLTCGSTSYNVPYLNQINEDKNISDLILNRKSTSSCYLKEEKSLLYIPFREYKISANLMPDTHPLWGFSYTEIPFQDKKNDSFTHKYFYISTPDSYNLYAVDLVDKKTRWQIQLDSLLSSLSFIPYCDSSKIYPLSFSMVNNDFLDDFMYNLYHDEYVLFDLSTKFEHHPNISVSFYLYESENICYSYYLFGNKQKENTLNFVNQENLPIQYGYNEMLRKWALNSYSIKEYYYKNRVKQPSKSLVCNVKIFWPVLRFLSLLFNLKSDCNLDNSNNFLSIIDRWRIQLKKNFFECVLEFFLPIIFLLIVYLFTEYASSGISPLQKEDTIGRIHFNKNFVLNKLDGKIQMFKGSFDNREAAIKRFDHSKITLFKNELEILRQFDSHQYILRYLGSELDNNYFYLAFQLYEGNLKDFLINDEFSLNQNEKIVIIRHLLKGLGFLHENDIAHCNINPESVLMRKSTVDSKWYAVLSNFCLSKVTKNSQEIIDERIITNEWRAPELIKGILPLTVACDIFSFGCLIYYFLTKGCHPFQDDNNLKDNNSSFILDLKQPNIFTIENYYEFKDIIKWMLKDDPNERPNVKQCLKHPLFWSLHKKLQFINDISNRLEKIHNSNEIIKKLQQGCIFIIRGNWLHVIPKDLNEKICSHRKYNGTSIRDLIRAIRNKCNHFIKAEQKNETVEFIKDNDAEIFLSEFPRLIVYTYVKISKTEIFSEYQFKKYY